jgi:predicted phosphoribosyltransferase
MIDPHYLGTVGQYYHNFDLVDDEKVAALLRSASKK